jgi:hypothetical protein
VKKVLSGASFNFLFVFASAALQAGGHLADDALVVRVRADTDDSTANL